MKNVTDGLAELRVVEIPADTPGPVTSQESVPAALLGQVKRMVVNETTETLARKSDPQELEPIDGMQVGGAGMITGAHTSHVKGARGRVAVIKREEGMWEVRRGHPVDGGERRRKAVRRKKLYEENQTKRP